MWVYVCIHHVQIYIQRQYFSESFWHLAAHINRFNSMYSKLQRKKI